MYFLEGSVGIHVAKPIRRPLSDTNQRQNAGRRRQWGDNFTNYPDVEVVFNLTEKAFHEFFVPNGIKIDFLHIDADHHYEGAKIDWDLYSTLVPDDGIITLHDTVNYREPCGVYLLLDEIREQGDYSVINFPIAYGTAIVQKVKPVDPRKAAASG